MTNEEYAAKLEKDWKERTAWLDALKASTRRNTRFCRAGQLWIDGLRNADIRLRRLI